MEELKDFEYGKNQDGFSFRELIMQKLTAARELKLKQTRSSSTTPDPKQAPNSRQAPQAWEVEKQLLINMFEKAQQFASQTQQAFIQERQNMESQIESLNFILVDIQAKNKALEQQVEVFKKVVKGEGEMKLIEELQNLEKLSDERELKYQQEIEILKTELNEMRNKLNESENGAKRKGSIKDVKKNNDYENLMKNTQNALKEKNMEIEKLKEELERVNKKTSGNKGGLKTENGIFEHSFENILKSARERESLLVKENEKLKLSISQLTQLIESKENDNKTQLEIMNKRVNDLSTQESKLISERESLIKEKSLLIEQVAHLNQKQEQSINLINTKNTKEIALLQENIREKEKNIAQLKEANANSNANKHAAEKEELKQLISQMLTEISNLLNSENPAAIELEECKKKLNELETNNSQIESSNLRIQLQKATEEKNYAKKLIISYIRSIQQLEHLISEKSTMNIDDHVATLQLESSRLHEENLCLVDAIHQKEKNYELEISRLQTLLQNQNIELKDAQTKLKTKESAHHVSQIETRNKAIVDLQNQMIMRLESLNAPKVKEGLPVKNKKLGKIFKK